jgi:hypothetical protein
MEMARSGGCGNSSAAISVAWLNMR